MIAHSQLAPLPNELPFRIVSKTIGQGAYACVKKAAPLDSPGPVFAVKFIHKDYATRHGRLNKKQLDLETSLHEYLGAHANLVQFFSSGEDYTWRWIAMELAEGGDLFDKIESDVGVGEDIAHLYFTQLISAVAYMHSKGVGHRDIKPENILLSTGGSLKIADFGLAVLFEYKGQKKLCSSSCGSPPYTAPEVVTCDHRVKKRLDQGYFGPLVDIWSCAVVLFVLLVGNTPWDEPLERSYEFSEYLKASGRPDDELWDKLSDEIVQLLRAMMRIEPTERMTLEDIQRHPWFRRQNPYLDSNGRLEHPVQLATQMFESMRIDFSKDPVLSQRSQRSGDAMDIDEIQSSRQNDSTDSRTPNNEIMFDWETRGHLSNGDLPAAANSAAISQLSWDEQLAEEPLCSQFSSTPRVPLTRTQFARQFHDIIPSQSLTRFFSFWSTEQLRNALQDALQKIFLLKSDGSSQVGSDEVASIRIRAMDGRNCPISGDIFIERLFGVEGQAHEVNFVKIKGDPVEWRRLFKKVVVLCKDAVFKPDQSIALLSQSSVL
ncbi:uncharacterized protein KY384_001539 [Bacidia gigantensis]|uniref:uncharacterized protein n=1 Tax=Bacidia gigantensis TaxID=2732470 RepID=UPI001D0543F6|nr:uncharacterized protein KY384_001539 [Bacidia gigantensis]KAG8533798.1 hypothetical protein KY384_001539 [Bacidia gigantensis]